MITLKEALKLSKEEIKSLRAELEEKILASKNLGAYVEQLADLPIAKLGEGVPIAIKDNIQVKGWSITSASKILQSYVTPYRSMSMTFSILIMSLRPNFLLRAFMISATV